MARHHSESSHSDTTATTNLQRKTSTRLPYWLLPVIASIVWVGTLIAMLVVWVYEGRPHYVSMSPDQKIAYISDVGADILKPLFVAGSCVTAAGFLLSLLSERWLRHSGKLTANDSTFQKVLSVIAILGAVVGTVGLVCLSIFDTKRHPKMHDTFLAVFIGGVLVSALGTVLEFWRLENHHRQIRGLYISFWIKVVFFVVELILAIVFGVLMTKDISDPAACVEWAVAFVFTGYLLSFLFDLLPATKATPGRLTHDLEKPAPRNF